MKEIHLPPELGMFTFRDLMRKQAIPFDIDFRNGLILVEELDAAKTERIIHDCVSGKYLHEIKPLREGLRKFVAHLFI